MKMGNINLKMEKHRGKAISGKTEPIESAAYAIANCIAYIYENSNDDEVEAERILKANTILYLMNTEEVKGACEKFIESAKVLEEILSNKNINDEMYRQEKFEYDS